MHVWPLYAGLALTACVASWRCHDLRPVGLALVASWAASNAAHYWLSVPERPAAYTVAEAGVMSMAFLAHVCGGSRWLRAVVAVCIVSIGLNMYATMLAPMTKAQLNGWELATNLCFGMECLTVISVGFYDRARAWISARSRPFALHGRAADTKEANR